MPVFVCLCSCLLMSLCVLPCVVNVLGVLLSMLRVAHLSTTKRYKDGHECAYIQCWMLLLANTSQRARLAVSTRGSTSKIGCEHTLLRE